MAFTKITNADLASRGATTLPNQPEISAQALKEEFDAPAKEVVAPKVNNLIDELEATTAAANLGAVAPTGISGNTIQLILNALSTAVRTIQAQQIGANPSPGQIGDNVQDLLDDLSSSITTIQESINDLNAKKHSHPNKALLDSYEQTEADLSDAVAKKHTHSNKSTLDKLSEDSSGNPTFDGNTIPTSGGTGGFQKFIDQDTIAPSGSGNTGELMFVGGEGNNEKDLYRYEDGGWVKVELGPVLEGDITVTTPTTPLRHISISTYDMGEGEPAADDTIYLVIEE